MNSNGFNMYTNLYLRLLVEFGMYLMSRIYNSISFECLCRTYILNIFISNIDLINSACI